jgi:hypothetical protein
MDCQPTRSATSGILSITLAALTFGVGCKKASTPAEFTPVPPGNAEQTFADALSSPDYKRWYGSLPNETRAAGFDKHFKRTEGEIEQGVDFNFGTVSLHSKFTPEMFVASIKQTQTALDQIKRLLPAVQARLTNDANLATTLTAQAETDLAVLMGDRQFQEQLRDIAATGNRPFDCKEYSICAASVILHRAGDYVNSDGYRLGIANGIIVHPQAPQGLGHQWIIFQANGGPLVHFEASAVAAGRNLEEFSWHDPRYIPFNSLDLENAVSKDGGTHTSVKSIRGAIYRMPDWPAE